MATDTPAKDRDEKATDRRPWRSPLFTELADVHDTSKAFTPVDFITSGPS
ncbi:hypothetical protein GCM10008942_09340 [Rhizomicrobium electricum]|uniref:Uncharacterized protein n=2 Tax=Rhizomicrobium electricum TaxID=480070 RepID=A0ABN1EBA8_9PROT